MFYGEACENKQGASGAFSLLLLIFVVAMVVAGVGLLHYSKLEKSRNESMGGGRYAQNQRQYLPREL